MPRHLRLALLCICSVLAADAGTITVIPSTVFPVIGGTLSVDIDITDAVDLYAFQFDVSFIPGVLSAIAITDGGFLGGGGFFAGFIDNGAGSITFIADTLAGPVPGITGTGKLARLEFTAIGTGMSSITVLNALLLDSTLTEGSVNVFNAEVVVEPGSTDVPEPNWFFLLLATNAAILLAHRFCRVRF